MDRLIQRLNSIWERQGPSLLPPHPEHDPFSSTMGVTFKKPMKISGTMLSPGRYEFRLLLPGTKHKWDASGRRDRVELFSRDQTRPVAELTPELEN